MRLDDPQVVRREYADETRFSIRQSTWNSSSGPDVHGVVIGVLRGRSPRRVLEVGSGKGELAKRVASELGADVIAVDQSGRMVERARRRGVTPSSRPGCSTTCRISSWACRKRLESSPRTGASWP